MSSRADLGGLGRPAGDGHRAAGDEGRDEERRRVREVGFDVDVDASDGARGDDPAPGLGVVDLDTARGEGRDGHLDVGEARQPFTRVAQVESALEAGGRQQEGGDELARRRCVDLEFAAPDRTGAVHGERERTAAVVVEVDPERLQPVDHAGHGAAPGVLVAVEGGRAEGECRHGGQEAHHRAGEAAVDRGRAEQLGGGRDAQVVTEPPGAGDAFEARAEGAQPIDHQLAVARPERRVQGRRRRRRVRPARARDS